MENYSINRRNSYYLRKKIQNKQSKKQLQAITEEFALLAIQGHKFRQNFRVLRKYFKKVKCHSSWYKKSLVFIVLLTNAFK